MEDVAAVRTANSNLAREFTESEPAQRKFKSYSKLKFGLSPELSVQH